MLLGPHIGLPQTGRRLTPSLATLYRGLNLPVDCWIDDANGDDSNAGTTESAAWQSLNKIDSVPLSAGETKTVRVKTGVYDKDTDLINAAQAATGATLNVVFEANCENDGAAYTAANSTGSFFSTVNDKHIKLFGNGIRVHGWTQGTGNGLGGNGADANCSYDAYDFEIYDCIDGISCHGNMVANFYDCYVYDCTKANVAHIGGTVTTHTRCVFEELLAGASLAVVNIQGLSSEFTDCIIIPASSGAALDLSESVLRRCQIGSLSKAVTLSGNENVEIIDSFMNVSADANAELDMLRCYGLLSIRQRNGGSIALRHSIISGPASNASSVFYNNFNPGAGSQHVIEDNIFETASAGAFMSYDANNSGYLVAASSRWHNNVLSGSAAFDADLTAADTGGTVIVDNVTGDALIGAANTLDPDDYGYGAGSPAIGAATDGANSGFAIGDVAAPTPRQIRGVDPVS